MDDKKTISSVLQSDERFSSKILARQSTVGSCSSRFFYRASEGVPFQWEKHPGKPITPQPDEVLPPLSPPPAVLAMALPKPFINIVDEPKAKRWSSAWIGKKIKKTLESHGFHIGGIRKITYEIQQPNFGSQRYYSESIRYSTSSFASFSRSSSSSISFNDKNSSNVNPSKALLQGRPFTCGLKGLSDTVVYFVKKN